MLRFSNLMVATAALLLVQAHVAGAYPGGDGAVATRYPAATNLETCGTCHVAFDGFSDTTLNAYGADVFANLVNFDLDAAMAAVEGTDSDGDGATNLDEINNDTGFFPGWTCETYVNAAGAPELSHQF